MHIWLITGRAKNHKMRGVWLRCADCGQQAIVESFSQKQWRLARKDLPEVPWDGPEPAAKDYFGADQFHDRIWVNCESCDAPYYIVETIKVAESFVENDPATGDRPYLAFDELPGPCAVCGVEIGKPVGTWEEAVTAVKAIRNNTANYLN